MWLTFFHFGSIIPWQYAHANAIRQATHMVPGPVRVVVGIHSDAEIIRYIIPSVSNILNRQFHRNKGPPLFKQTERHNPSTQSFFLILTWFASTQRYALVEGCRWVDQVVHDVPYSANMTLLRQYGIGRCFKREITAININPRFCGSRRWHCYGMTHFWFQ